MAATVTSAPALKGETISDLPPHLRLKKPRLRVVPGDYIRKLKKFKGSKINPFPVAPKWKYDPTFEFDLKAQFQGVPPNQQKPLMSQKEVEKLDARVNSTPEPEPLQTPPAPPRPRFGPTRGDLDQISVIDLTEYESPLIVDLTRSPTVIDLTETQESPKSVMNWKDMFSEDFTDIGITPENTL